jgi:hypothetical protein
VDGDGVDDLIIGSPSADGPSGDRADAGRTDVFFGSSNLAEEGDTRDLATSSHLTIHGSTSGDLAGFSVGSGRLNADAADDLVIGAFYAGGPSDSRPLSGEVYGILGGAGRRGSAVDLAVISADITVFGAEADDRLGEGLAAGDVNADGIDDLILPAPFAINLMGAQDAGRTYVLHSPLPTTIDLSTFVPAATIYGVDDGDQLGHISVAGELDGADGEDLLLTAVSADGRDNKVDLAGEAAVILSGRLSNGINVAAGGADSVIYGTLPAGRLGRSAAAGDIDGDRVDEILLGTPGTPSANGEAGGGTLYVVPVQSLGSEVLVDEAAQVYTAEEGGAALGTEIYGRTPIEVTDLDNSPGGEIIVTASGGNGPTGGREDCGYALILFITR